MTGWASVADSGTIAGIGFPERDHSRDVLDTAVLVEPEEHHGSLAHRQLEERSPERPSSSGAGTVPRVAGRLGKLGGGQLVAPSTLAEP